MKVILNRGALSGLPEWLMREFNFKSEREARTDHDLIDLVEHPKKYNDPEVDLLSDFLAVVDIPDEATDWAQVSTVDDLGAMIVYVLDGKLNFAIPED